MHPSALSCFWLYLTVVIRGNCASIQLQRGFDAQIVSMTDGGSASGKEGEGRKPDLTKVSPIIEARFRRIRTASIRASEFANDLFNDERRRARLGLSTRIISRDNDDDDGAGRGVKC